jgi:hypothetical protein
MHLSAKRYLPNPGGDLKTTGTWEIWNKELPTLANGPPWLPLVPSPS